MCASNVDVYIVAIASQAHLPWGNRQKCQEKVALSPQDLVNFVKHTVMEFYIYSHKVCKMHGLSEIITSRLVQL